MEFANILEESEQLNKRLKVFLQELKRVCVLVQNDVPLAGWCEAGINGKYEKSTS